MSYCFFRLPADQKQRMLNMLPASVQADDSTAEVMDVDDLHVTLHVFPKGWQPTEEQLQGILGMFRFVEPRSLVLSVFEMGTFALHPVKPKLSEEMNPQVPVILRYRPISHPKDKYATETGGLLKFFVDVRDYLESLGVPLMRTFPLYQPHTTLAYVDADIFPSGGAKQESLSREIPFDLEAIFPTEIEFHFDNPETESTTVHIVPIRYV